MHIENLKTDNCAHTTEVRVRYADTDQMGIAYYGIYLTWLEIGRTEFLRDTGLTYQEVEKFGIRLPLLETGIKYLKPAHYDDVLSIVTSLKYHRGVRVRFEYEIWQSEDMLATGFTEHVFTDTKLHPTRPPKDLTAILHKSFEKSPTFLKKGCIHD